MQFINLMDANPQWSLESVIEITTKIFEYCKAHNIKDASLTRVEDNTWADELNERYDIEIAYTDEAGRETRQILLYLCGQIVDGEEFHKRYKEFYPDRYDRRSA